MLVYEICPEEVHPLLIWEWFELHSCNLAAKESGLQCTWMINDDFTVLVSGGGRHCWVSMCTVWPSHSKWLSKKSNKSASNFVISLNIPLWKLFRWFRTCSPDNWWLAASSRQCACSCNTSSTEIFGETSNHPGDSAPIQPRFGALWLLAFPQTKITFERGEISDHQWDSGKYDGAADGDWENCMRSQGAYFEGDWGVIFLPTVFLVPSSINVSIYHSTWMDTF